MEKTMIVRWIFIVCMQNNPPRNRWETEYQRSWSVCLSVRIVYKTTMKYKKKHTNNNDDDELTVDVQTRANIMRAMRKKCVQTGRSHVGN